MRIRSFRAAFAALAIATISCSGNDITGPDAAAPTLRTDVIVTAIPDVRISEIHYDDAGTDINEKVEVSFPDGVSLSGWSIVLYNGANGRSYDSDLLTALVPNMCGDRGVVVLSYAVDGIQNGAPDGLALVDNNGAVVEFISYEGSTSPMTATNGPASGMVARDIGVVESGEIEGMSLSRDKAGTWLMPAAQTFGDCNDNSDPVAANVVSSVTLLPETSTRIQTATQQFTATARNASDALIRGATIIWTSSDPSIAKVSPNGLVTALLPGDVEITAASTNGVSDVASFHVDAAPPPAGLSPIRFTELHYDNASGDINEKIEIEGPAGTNLTGWKVVLYNGNGGASYNTVTLAATIPLMCDGRGVIVVDYPANGIQNGAPDGMTLVNASGLVVEFLSYEGTFTATDGPALNLLSTDIVRFQNGSAVGKSLQRDATGTWYGPFANTFGACNPAAAPPPAVVIFGRDAGDPILPVGFQDQLFASLEDAYSNTIETTFTWSTDTPGIASIDQDGVVTALAAGTGILRATAATGATGTFSLPTHVATLSATQYTGNAEFGEPTDASPIDDFIIRYPTFTTSFNSTRGTPNWVSYEIDATHFGEEDRCDCFTYDPALPGSYTRYTTADYTGAGAFHGYGIDRGHMARSFDRTAGSLDNAQTYYFSNIVPQAADQNQGPWAEMENDMGDSARFFNKEVYIVAGVAGNKGTIKNEGLIVIPEYTWKIAVIMPRDQGLDDVNDAGDLQVIAVAMPNIAGIRGDAWQDYIVTVDSVERLSGYDVLALLPDHLEAAIESGAQEAIDILAQMKADGILKQGNANALQKKLDAAVASLVRGQTIAAVNQLESLIRQLDALVAGGVLTVSEAAALRAKVLEVIATVSD